MESAGRAAGTVAPQEVPVPLSLLWKTVGEDDQGAIYLNATVVQSVLLEPATTPEQLEKYRPQDLLFEMRVNEGPIAGGEIGSGIKSVEGVRGCVMVHETLELKNIPLDVCLQKSW
ncbi:unnamed protein product [Ectocarpus sp. CCAP 1310/34]|nr:unnamed protein product [Ectocarpus sp. CCAP 1310/34]